VTFESGFADAERSAASAGKVIGQLAGAMKELHRAATDGDIAKMRKSSDRLATVLESTRQEVQNARSAWPFTPEEEEQYLKEGYANEVVECARRENLQIQQREEGLVVFPSILRIAASDRAVKINRKKVQAIRPSALVRRLKAAQSVKTRSSEAFLEVLHRAYRLLVGNEYGKTITLTSIYEALTMLPGSAANYDQTDFVRDLFLLDRSAVKRTKSGAAYSLPASTGTKGGRNLFFLVAPDGENVTYYGIRFAQAEEVTE
jgi:hypothetical protein